MPASSTIKFLLVPFLINCILLIRRPVLPIIDLPGSKIILQFNFLEKLCTSLEYLLRLIGFSLSV